MEYSSNWIYVMKTPPVFTQALDLFFFMYLFPCTVEAPAQKRRKKKVKKETNGVDDIDGTLHINTHLQ